MKLKKQFEANLLTFGMDNQVSECERITEEFTYTFNIWLTTKCKLKDMLWHYKGKSMTCANLIKVFREEMQY